MATASKRKHTHRRSSSLVEEPQKNILLQQTVLISQITSQETMKLIEESQHKNQFQIIVDSLEVEHPVSPPSDSNCSKRHALPRQLSSKSLLDDYFQIQSLQSLRSNNPRENIEFEGLTLDKLGAHPREHSRLRYHVNSQLKAFKDASKKLSFSKNSPYMVQGLAQKLDFFALYNLNHSISVIMNEQQALKYRWEISHERNKLIQLGAIFLSDKICRKANKQQIKSFLYKKTFDDDMITRAEEKSKIYILYDNCHDSIYLSAKQPKI